MARIARAARCVAAAVGLALVAACGGGSEVAPEDATVTVTDVAGVGSVLVDSSGRTLYTNDQDGADIACVDDCASVWPPLTLPGGESKPTVSGEVSEEVGTVTRPDGSVQVTYGGAPLYLFSLDKEKGAATGDGVKDDFAGTTFTWQAAAVSRSEPVPSPDDGGGYDY